MPNLYERFVVPRLIEVVCGTKLVAAQREKVVGRARGVVLEIGIGSGHNLPLYDARAVSKVIGVDPSVELGKKALERAAALPFPVELRAEGGEVDVVPPGSVDTAVLTYTLCTVPSVPAVLAAARRALKPDALVLFCEHTLAPDASVQKWQRRIEPVWRPLAGGCHLTRDAAALLGEAGFRIDEIERAYVPRTPRFAGFHQIGVARPVNAGTTGNAA